MGRTTHLNKPSAMLNAPRPPDDLPLIGKALWEQTIGARPASEWNSADVTLMLLYVNAALDVRRLDKEIATQGEVIDGRINPLVTVRAGREALLLATAAKLRLAPSSRYTARRVGELHRHAIKASKAAATIEDDDLLAKPGRLQ